MSLEVPRTLIAQLQLTNLLLCAVQSKTLLRLFQWRGGQERVLVLWLCNQAFLIHSDTRQTQGVKINIRRCLAKMKNARQNDQQFHDKDNELKKVKELLKK